MFYVGGADPYREDQLGGLWLTLSGLRQRDLLAFGEARRRGVPVAATLAGGYARNVADTVRIHVLPTAHFAVMYGQFAKNSGTRFFEFHQHGVKIYAVERVTPSLPPCSAE